MWSLVFLASFSIVGCGFISGFKTNVEIRSEKTTTILHEGEHTLLNCTASVIERKPFSSTQPYYFELTIIDLGKKKIRNTSQVVFSNGMRSRYDQWITFRVYHQFYTPSKDFSCELSSNFTGFVTDTKTTSVIFANPPQAPTNISCIILRKNLYIFADSPYNKLVRTTLGITYSLRIRGTNCPNSSKEAWTSISTCEVSQRGSENTIVCMVESVMEFEKCSSSLAVIIISNHGDNGKIASQIFTITNVKETKPFVFVDNVYNSSNILLVQLADNTKLTKFHEIHYKIKYWPIKSSNDKTEIASFSPSITLKDLAPNQCYYLSAKFEVSIYSTEERIIADWTVPRLECTTVKKISVAPRNVTCYEITPPTGKDGATVKLMYTSPDVNADIYGNITSYKLDTIIYAPQLLKNISLNASVATSNTDIYQLFLRNDEYKFSRFLSYQLSACNDVGCSETYESCQLLLSDPPPSVRERIPLAILLSCLVPSIIIVLLVMGAFISYYTKKDIAKDLEVPLTLDGETNHAAEGNSSQESETEMNNNNNNKRPPARLPPQLTEETNGRRDSYADDNITSANNKDKKLFVKAALSNEKERELNRQMELQALREQEKLERLRDKYGNASKRSVKT